MLRPGVLLKIVPVKKRICTAAQLSMSCYKLPKGRGRGSPS